MVTGGTAGGGGWYRSAVNVSLTASDDLSGVAATYYAVDDLTCTPPSGGAAVPASCTSGTTLTVSGDGSHTVTYFSLDKAGNVEPRKTLTVEIDTTAPATTAAAAATTTPRRDITLSLSSLSVGGVQLGPATCWITSGVAVTLAATDAGSGVAATQDALDGGAWTAYSSPVTITTPGFHTVQYRSTDTAGNQEQAESLSVVLFGPGNGRPGFACAAPTNTTPLPKHGVVQAAGTLTVTDAKGRTTTVPFNVSFTY